MSIMGTIGTSLQDGQSLMSEGKHQRNCSELTVCELSVNCLNCLCPETLHHNGWH